MTGLETLQAILELLYGGFTTAAGALGKGVSDIVSNLVYTTTTSGSVTTTELSPFIVMVAIFGGVALVVGLTRKIFGWLSSLGGRN